MKALTLRDIPPAVAKAIERRARATNTSLGRAALALIAEAAGVEPTSGDKRRDLAGLSGTWSDEEATAFDESLHEQRRIDPEAWR